MLQLKLGDLLEQFFLLAAVHILTLTTTAMFVATAIKSTFSC